jgi:hypothetical protein
MDDWRRRRRRGGTVWRQNDERVKIGRINVRGVRRGNEQLRRGECGQ